MKTIPHYCQNCGASNQLGERNCERCGTRLMLVVFPPAIRHDEGIVPSYYEDHLLERVTLLEIRLSQVAERLSTALDLMLRQSQNSNSDHLLLETLIDSLNTLGTVEKDKLTRKWHKSEKKEKSKESAEEYRKRTIKKVLSKHTGENTELLENLVKESLKLLAKNEEKQAFRTLEQAIQHSPNNVALLILFAHKLFEADRFDKAKTQLEKVISIEPNNEGALILLGIILADAFEIDSAKACFAKLPMRLKTTFCVEYSVGIMAVFVNDLKTAFDAFKIALTVNESAETHYLTGCVYFQLNKLKPAMDYFQSAVEMDENFADAWFMLAVVYQLIGDETKSFHSFDVAFTAKETGAECLRFAKNRQQYEISTALPFVRLKDLKKNLIMSNSVRFTRMLRREVSSILSE